MSTLWGLTSKALTRTIPTCLVTYYKSMDQVQEDPKDHICESQIHFPCDLEGGVHTCAQCCRCCRSTSKVSTANVHKGSAVERKHTHFNKTHAGKKIKKEIHLIEINYLLPGLEARSGWCHSQALEAIHNSWRGVKYPTTTHVHMACGFSNQLTSIWLQYLRECIQPPVGGGNESQKHRSCNQALTKAMDAEKQRAATF